MNTRCPDDKSLESLLGTDLDDPERFRLESHLDDCELCQTRLLELAGATDSVPGDRSIETVYPDRPTDEFLESLKQMIMQATTADMPLVPAESGTVEIDASGPPWPELPGLDLLEVIGKGGMGTVYKGVQRALERVVAVKVIRLGDHEEQLRERARKAASLLANAQHPHIVRIHFVGEAPGLVFGVLEYVPGGDLKANLKQGPWPLGRAIQFMEVLARVVGFLHEKGIVHGDLKPANILMASPSTPRLADFGIARAIREGMEKDSNAELGGTLCYMAPEQFVASDMPVSPAADVHALGVIFHEILTGRTPFDVRPRSLVPERIRTFEAEPLSTIRSGIPPAVDAIYLKCLRKNPAERYPNAGALADDIRAWIESLRA